MLPIATAADFFVTRIYLYQLTGKPLINDDYAIGVTKEEFAEALAYTQRLYDENVILPLEESLLYEGAPQDTPGWNTNMFGGWFNWASSANLQDWGDNAVALPYPKLADAKQSSYIVRPAQVFSIANNSQYIDEAVDFID
jgi:oligogalacturonide transport system substrate-binding protein